MYAVRRFIALHQDEIQVGKHVEAVHSDESLDGINACMNDAYVTIYTKHTAMNR